MNRIISTLLLVFCLFPYSAIAKETEDLYSQLNRAVIRLEHIEAIQKEGSPNVITQNKPDGTAFFVQSGGACLLYLRDTWLSSHMIFMPGSNVST